MTERVYIGQNCSSSMVEFFKKSEIARKLLLKWEHYENNNGFKPPWMILITIPTFCHNCLHKERFIYKSSFPLCPQSVGANKAKPFDRYNQITPLKTKTKKHLNYDINVVGSTILQTSLEIIKGMLKKNIIIIPKYYKAMAAECIIINTIFWSCYSLK